MAGKTERHHDTTTDQISRLTHALDSRVVARSESEWRLRSDCNPEKERKKASFALNIDNGVGCCHRGSFSGGAREVAEFFGVELEPGRDTGAWTLLATFVYNDELGAPLYHKRKYCLPTGGKTYVCYRVEPDGSLEKGLDKTRRVLYRLDELIKSEGKVVFIVEGEKDVDTLRALDCVATSGFAGAGKWNDEDSAHFQGRDVVILPDDDEPGQSHAEKVASKLCGIASRVRILKLPNHDGVSGWDISDWAASGGIRETLVELLTTAEDFMPDDTAEDDDFFVSVTSLGELPAVEEPGFAVEGLIHDETLNILGGDPKSGKTMVALDTALGFLTGESVLGVYRANRCGPVVFIETEMAQGYFSHVLSQLARGKDIESFKHPLSFRCYPPLDLADDATRSRLRSEILRQEPALAVFDSMRNMFVGNENASGETKCVLDFCLDIRSATGAVVILIDHLTKPNGRPLGGSPGYQLRGAGSKFGAADSMFIVTRGQGKTYSKVEAIHRQGSTPEPWCFELDVDECPAGRGYRLELFDPPTNGAGGKESDEDRVLAVLRDDVWLSVNQIRETARIGHKKLSTALVNLLGRRLVENRDGPRGAKEWRRAPQDDEEIWE